TRHIHKYWNLSATSWLSVPCRMCQFLIGPHTAFGVDSLFLLSLSCTNNLFRN
ncbi:unnamed protein product, partial [Arabidopsis halleri]